MSLARHLGRIRAQSSATGIAKVGDQGPTDESKMCSASCREETGAQAPCLTEKYDNARADMGAVTILGLGSHFKLLLCP